MYLISVRLLLSIQYAGIDHQSYDTYVILNCWKVTWKKCRKHDLNTLFTSSPIIIAVVIRINLLELMFRHQTHLFTIYTKEKKINATLGAQRSWKKKKNVNLFSIKFRDSIIQTNSTRGRLRTRTHLPHRRNFGCRLQFYHFLLKFSHFFQALLCRFLFRASNSLFVLPA